MLRSWARALERCIWAAILVAREYVNLFNADWTRFRVLPNCTSPCSPRCASDCVSLAVNASFWLYVGRRHLHANRERVLAAHFIRLRSQGLL